MGRKEFILKESEIGNDGKQRYTLEEVAQSIAGFSWILIFCTFFILPAGSIALGIFIFCRIIFAKNYMFGSLLISNILTIIYIYSHYQYEWNLFFGDNSNPNSPEYDYAMLKTFHDFFWASVTGILSYVVLFFISKK